MNPVDMLPGTGRGSFNLHELFLESNRFDGVLLLGLGWRRFGRIPEILVR